MQTYCYRVIDQQGIEKRGRLSAADFKSAESMLREKGLLIKKISVRRSFIKKSKKINADDFIQFITEFTALIKAGLTVPEAIKQSSGRPGNPGLANALKNTLKSIMEGAYLSDALAANPEAFDNVMISAVKTGEMAGDLVSPMEKYRAYLERRNNLKKKITQALTYPVFIMAAMLIILVVLFMFVMPRFVTLYSDFGAELPAPTRFLFFIVSNIKYIIPALIAACMAFVFMLKTAGRQSKIKYKFAEIQLRLPFVAAIIEPLENASLARTLFTLLSGGMPLADAFETASGTIKNAFYSSRLENVRLKVNSGIGFAAAAASENLFPPTAIKLLEAGESSGTMPAMLGEIASYYEQIAENRINSIMTIIEPTLIFLTGILVGGVVIIMYLPVFQLTEIVK